MGPLSAVALIVWLALLASTWLTWISASVKVLAVVALIAAVLILLDVFVIGSGPRYTAWRERNRRTVA